MNPDMKPGEKEEILRLIAENTTDLIAVVDTKGNRIYNSNSYRDVLGDPATLRGTNSFADIHPDDRERVRSAFEEAIRTGNGQKVEYRMLVKDGTVRYFQSQSNVIKDAHGATTSVVIISRDLTDTWKVEVTRKESDAYIRQILSTALDAVITIGANGNIVGWNRQAEFVFGWSEKEIVGQSVLNTIIPPECRSARGRFWKSLDGCPFDCRVETLAVRRNGDRFPVELSMTALRREGYPDAFSAFVRDITERKAVETTLQKRESGFRSLIEHSTDAIALLDESGKVLFASSSTERVIGYTNEEFVGTNIFDIFHPDEVSRIQQILHGLLQEPGSIAQAEVQYRHKDGSWRWLEGTGTNLLHDEAVGGIVGNYRDITEQKKAIEDLQKVEERYRVFVEQSSEGIWRFELDTPMPLTLSEDEQIDFFYAHAYLAQCNDAMARMYGFSRAEELNGARLARFLIRSEAHNITYLRSFIRSNYRLSGGESHEPDSDGIMKYFLNNLVGVVENGFLVRAWGTQRDITEAKQTENRIAVLAHALRSVTEGVNLTDLDDNILFVNKAFRRQYGYSEEELIGQPITMVRSPKSPAALSDEIQRGTFHGGWEGEVWQRRKDGSEFLASLSTSVVRGENGEPIAFMGVSRDITEKVGNQKLQNCLYRIAEAVDASPQLDDLYRAVHDIIGEVMPANNFYIALYDEDEDLLHFPYFVDEVDIPSPPMKPGKGVTAYVLHTGKSLLCSEDIFADLVRQNHVELVGVPSPIWLGVPLIVSGKTIGVMVVQHYSNPLAYGQVELHMLEYVSSQVAKAIERKRNEVALRESEERYRSMFEEDLTGNFISTPSGRILDCNPAFAQIFGFSSVEEALQSDCRTLHKNAETRESMFELLRKHRALKYYETELRTKAGRPIHVVANLIGAFDQDDRLISVKGYLFDNTARKQLEDQLLQSQKMEAVGQLASGIAHDFNNVMGVALTAAQMIKSQSAESIIVRYAGMIEDATMRGASIARQLLQFSRAEAVRLKPISLSHCVTELRKILEHSFPKTLAIKILIDLKHGTIMGDEGQIHQVLLNICINARDAMTPSDDQQPQGTLSIVLESASENFMRDKFGETGERGFAVVRVSDTGSGMTPEVKRRMFEPFFTTKEIGKGTGLGLSIVHGIMKSHHGYVDVTSEAGKGSTFSIYFPIIPNQMTNGSSLQGIPSKGAGERILVIEDEEVLRSLVNEILSKSGYSVVEARDGEEGLRLYRDQPDEFKMVLSDMGLPKLSGEQVFFHLRKINPDVKVVFSTGHIREEKKRELLAAGAEDFVHKPYKIDEMLTSIRRVLDKDDNKN